MEASFTDMELDVIKCHGCSSVKKLLFMCRSSSLRKLLRVQAEFEAAVKELQEGVELRWGRLEELHTGVTLTREGDQNRADLASAHQNAEVIMHVYVPPVTDWKPVQGCRLDDWSFRDFFRVVLL